MDETETELEKLINGKHRAVVEAFMEPRERFWQLVREAGEANESMAALLKIMNSETGKKTESGTKKDIESHIKKDINRLNKYRAMKK